MVRGAVVVTGSSVGTDIVSGVSPGSSVPMDMVSGVSDVSTSGWMGTDMVSGRSFTVASCCSI
jgi:hypothetical protein